MFRAHPFLSLQGFLTLVIISLGLGVSIWWKGDTLFSPGELTRIGRIGGTSSDFSSHADFESQCERCHTPFGATQADLCIQCHMDVKDQLTSQQGTHGKLVGVQQCRDCHPDHRGRDFNVTEAAFSQFDHSFTNFSLTLHENDYKKEPIVCYDCHLQANGFQVNLLACENCHTTHDPAFMIEHIKIAGSSCLACHDGLDTLANFDHSSVRFPLEGMHTQVSCVDCHPGFEFRETPMECFACHMEPASHFNRFPRDCQICHTPSTWVDVQFDHTLTTSECFDCHKGDLPPDHFGDQCAACHNTNTWIPASFDHALAEAIDCIACHLVDKPDDHYEGQCSLCHSPLTWEDAVFDHTNQTDCQLCHQMDAPVNHYPGQCSACHVTKNWGEVSFNHSGFSDCIACHLSDRPSDHDDGQCLQCHNTIDWDDADDDNDNDD